MATCLGREGGKMEIFDRRTWSPLPGSGDLLNAQVPTYLLQSRSKPAYEV